MNRKEIHKKVITHFGGKAQIDKALEELNELADVKNMMEQIEIMIGIKIKEVTEMQDLKMIRTLEIMNK